MLSEKIVFEMRELVLEWWHFYKNQITLGSRVNDKNSNK